METLGSQVSDAVGGLNTGVAGQLIGVVCATQGNGRRCDILNYYCSTARSSVQTIISGCPCPGYTVGIGT
jgi:hypothetical protein